MRIAVIGPGAMGCLFAAHLTRSGQDVTLIDHRPERAAKLDRDGLVLEGVRGHLEVRVPTTCDAASLGPVEAVLVCVKACQTEAALAQHRALVGPDTLVFSAQNGLGNLEAMARVVPRAQVVGGSTTLGANLLGPGRVDHAGDGETLLGELDGARTARSERLAEALAAAGLEARISDDIRRVIWSKLLVNVGINALTALLWVRNGELVEHASALRLMRAAVAEAVAVASAEGLSFELEDTLARVEQVARRTAQNRSSMLADLQAGRRTEVDFINGAIAARGQAPVNRTLTDLIHALEDTAGKRLGPVDDPRPKGS